MGLSEQERTPAARDVGRIEPGECVRRSLPPMLSQRGRGFQVVVKQSVLNHVHGHGHSRLDAEVCGVLAGTLCHDANGPYLHVEAAVSGAGATSAAANVTFTAETWTAIQDEMERSHPDLRIVGWYHTHPGFGIFLSGMDLFIHESFFDLPWQVAFVYDPIGGDEGMFVWHDNKAVRQSVLVHDDAVRQRYVVDPAKVPAVIETAEHPADGSPAATGESPLRQRGRMIALAVGALVVVLGGLALLAWWMAPPAPPESAPAPATRAVGC